VLTNNHVVQDATKLTVELKDGDKYVATVIGKDPSIDLALIKIDPGDKPLPVLTLGDSQELRVGEWVLAVGNPLGLDYTVTVGVVSAKARNFSIGETIPGVASFIQTDAAINKGNSGGPLVNSRGQVVGISTAIFRGGFDNPLVEGVGFALPINVARDAVQQLLETGSVQRGFLGITMNSIDIDPDSRDYYGLPDTHGVLVTEVQPDLPADKAGIRRNDVIRSVNGEAIDDSNELLGKIATRRPGETVELGIFRDGKTIAVPVTLTSRAEANLRPGRTGAPSVAPVPEETPADDLGIEVDEITPALRDRLQLDEDVTGVVVTDVDASSIAADKGIAPSMVITAVDDKPIRGIDDWNRAMSKLDVGDIVMFEIRFGQQKLLVHFKVPEKH
jgi:serine protease Do